MKILSGGITAAKGFLATGNHIGIKKQKKDLALLCSTVPAKAAGMFTTNLVKAAPVLWNQKLVDQKKQIKGIVVNSGNANACTGEEGILHNQMMAEAFGGCLQADKEEILAASTGVIGVPLPIEKIQQGILSTSETLGASQVNGKWAAEAIMTTDTFSKEIAVEILIGEKSVKIGGMAKGSGMIHPNMATMLSFITTDALISQELLQKLLKGSVEDSYNMISVDGDTSTNDMVIVLANGLAENEEIQEGTENCKMFQEALHYVNTYLAQQIIHDGEGASKFLEVTVSGAKTKEDARKLSKSITSSSLVKTAFFGEDANWGRVICAMGYAAADFDPNHVDIRFASPAGEIALMEDGKPLAFDEEMALEILQEKEIQILVQLFEGEASATAWGCDLSYEYVRINGDYRT